MKKLNKKLQLNKEVKNKYSHFLTPFCLVLVSCIFPVLLFAQHRKFTGIIEGIILDVNTRLPVPYARVHNLATGMETASNKDGLFSIHIVDYNDVIPIHHLGYQDDTLKINPNLKTNTVYLKPNTYELKEVIVKKKKTDYLYTLLEQCRDKMGNWLNERSAKASYELKTYVNGQQVELAEAFYNADLGGHDLKKLHLKNGRFALQTWEDRTFVSLDGSTVFTKSKLFTRDAYFPFSPVEFNKTLIKKYFQLKLQSILPMPDDTLYRVSFTPYRTSGIFFDGEVWVSPSRLKIRRITLHASTSEAHPFLPARATDSIVNVEMNIEKTFKEIEGASYLQDIRFNYIIDYKSMPGTPRERVYQTRAQGSLSMYDFDHLFELPLFNFEPADDYYNISAIPYNDFFWNYNDEAVKRENITANDDFYFSPNSFKNTDLKFSLSPTKLYQPLMYLFLHWSPERQNIIKIPSIKKKFYNEYDPSMNWDIEFQESSIHAERMDILNPLNKYRATVRPFLSASDYYNFGVSLFMDVDTYQDSTHVITDVLIDPAKFKFLLELNNYTECFINIYFDLVEMKRREFQRSVQYAKNHEYIRSSFTNLTFQVEDIRKEYTKNFAHTAGRDLRDMRPWNEMVKNALGIDNMEIFKLKTDYDRKKEENR